MSTQNVIDYGTIKNHVSYTKDNIPYILRTQLSNEVFVKVAIAILDLISLKTEPDMIKKVIAKHFAISEQDAKRAVLIVAIQYLEKKDGSIKI